MATSFKTINDVVERYVRPQLGSRAKFYYIDAIAREITYYRTVRDDDYDHLDRIQLILKEGYDPENEFFDADMFSFICEHFRTEN